MSVFRGLAIFKAALLNFSTASRIDFAGQGNRSAPGLIPGPVVTFGVTTVWKSSALSVELSATYTVPTVPVPSAIPIPVPAVSCSLPKSGPIWLPAESYSVTISPALKTSPWRHQRLRFRIGRGQSL